MHRYLVAAKAVAQGDVNLTYMVPPTPVGRGERERDRESE